MSWTGGGLLALASLALGQALQIRNGFLDPLAMCWLLAALALAFAAALAARRAAWDATARAALPWLLAAVVAIQTVELLAAAPLLYAPLPRGSDSHLIRFATIAMSLLALAILAAGTRVRIAAFVALVFVHASLGVWTIRTVPDPPIDVVTVHERAIGRLGAGRTPYSFTFKNIYGENSGFYAAGMERDGQVLFGLPYPPLTLAFAAPAQWIFGDFRYAHVAALAAAALLIGSLGWTRHALLSAAALLTTPRVLFVVEQGWTEPLAILLLSVTAAALWRSSPRSPIAFGLALAIKQYMVAALVLLPLVPRPAGMRLARFAAVAIAAAAAVTLPFFLWDPGGFVHSVVLLQFREPFRRDSLSVLAWLAAHGIWIPPIAATAIAAIVAATVALRALPRSTGGLAAGLAIVTFAMFVFGKKAFCNYYFFVLGAMAIATAASGEEGWPREQDDGRVP